MTDRAPGRRIFSLTSVVAAALLTSCAQHSPSPSQPSPPRAPESAAPLTPAATPAPPTPEAEPRAAAHTPPPPTPDPEARPGSLKEAFPGVFVDLTARVVEFDGIVPINAHDPAAPMVYLEVFACLPDTKEHEALVLTTVKPSHVHAALLLIGLNPGKPGGWDLIDDKLVPIQPTGDAVTIRVAYTDAAGARVSFAPEDLIVDATTGASFSRQTGGHWLFAGSRLVKRQGGEWYDADRAGMLIGLTTFGGETIAWSQTISPDSELQAPEWIASPRLTPPAGAPVRVSVSPAKK